MPKKREDKKQTKEKRKISKGLFWTPRIISILFIAFLALFSLDIFGNNYPFWETVIGLFMHNIPVFILLIILWISWKKHEWLIGTVFILGGLLYIARLLITILTNPPYQWYVLSWSITIAGPAFLIGILFFMNWFKKK